MAWESAGLRIRRENQRGEETFRLNGNKAQKATYALNDNINDILVSGNYCEIIPAWGNIGGLYPSWAWGIVLTSKNIANFIGVATVSKKLAVAQYSNGAWTKIM